TIINAVPLSIPELNRYANGTAINQLNRGNANFIPYTNDPDAFQKSKFVNGQIVLTQVLTDKLNLQSFYQGSQTKRRNTNGELGIGFQPFGGDENYLFDGQIHTFGANLNWNFIQNNQVKFGYEFETTKFGNEGVLTSGTQTYSVDTNES